MNDFLKRLIAFLTLGVDVEPDDPPTDDPPADDPPADDTPPVEAEGMSFDDLLTAAEDVLPADKAPKPNRERDLEMQLAEERGRRQALESRPAPAPLQQLPADPEAAREDAEYQRAVQAGEDEDRLAMRRWQIQSNRAIRNAARASSNAELNARDLADKAEFGRLEITNPKAYRRYATEVENMVAQARANGQAVPRKMVMQTLIGRDFLDGKIKPKSRTRATGTEASATVDRGRMPGTRSDVGRRNTGKLSPGQEAAKRLEGKLI